MVVFEAESKGERKTYHPTELVYIESASNYVKIYFTRKGAITYSIIRMTMKAAAESVAAHPVFFRCHRAFIVNLNKVDRVEGNAQGYKLRLQDVDESIPVSRSLNREFTDRLLEFRKED